MPKIKCYSVRLKSLVSISDQALKATGFDGSGAIIPKSQVFGDDFDVQRSEAYWITAWILERKELTYSTKKVGWFDPETGRQMPTFYIERHVPERIIPKETPPDATLIR